jgi:hypothetical protein
LKGISVDASKNGRVFIKVYALTLQERRNMREQSLAMGIE